MQIDISTAFEGLGGAVTAICGIYAAVRRVSKGYKSRKEAYRQGILDQAKSEMDKVKEELENKIQVQPQSTNDCGFFNIKKFQSYPSLRANAD